MTFLKGAEEVEIVEINIEEVQNNFKNLDFENIWEQVGTAWSNVNGLSSFFEALGASFTGLWESIINIGKIIYYTFEFVFVFITWITINFINITKFIIGYIFIQ